MTLYTVTTNFEDNFLFGNYSSLRAAREALENFFLTYYDTSFYEDVGNYTYLLDTCRGDRYWFEIVVNDLEEDNEEEE